MADEKRRHPEDFPAEPDQGSGADRIAGISEEDQVAAIRAERDELKDKFLRAQAECANISKRGQQQYSEALKFGAQNLARALLPVYDNLEKALDLLKDARKDDPLLQGVRMAVEELSKVFEQNGILPIEAVGKPFDPMLHEALMQDHESKLKPGTVSNEFQRGYRMHDRVLRPAKVMVSAEKPEAQHSESE